MPTEAEVVIKPEATPITKRQMAKLGTFQARAELVMPSVINTRPARSTARKPKRSVSRPRNNRLASAPNI